MGTQNGNSREKRAALGRRLVVLAVPPVDEFDLVCPIQVFGAANRLAGKPVYSVEVVTNGKDVKVQGEGGVLSFVAETSYKALNADFDSLLLVCGLGTRNARDQALFACDLLKDWNVVVRLGDRFERVYRGRDSNKALLVEFQGV